MKRLLALILALTMVFALSACGEENKKTNGEVPSGGEVDAVFTADDILASSAEVVSDVTSVAADYEMDMKVTAAGETVDVTMSGTMEYDSVNMLAHMTMKMATAGESLDIDMYMNFEGSDAIVYTNAMGTWVKQTMPVGDVSKLGMGYNGIDGLKAYLEGMENAEITMEGDSYKVVGNVGDMLTEDMMNSSMSSITSIDGFTEEMIDSILDCFKDIKYVMYIDAETFYPSVVEVDMSDAMATIFSSIPEMQSTGIEDIKYVAKFNYRDYNEDFNISIPAEAMDAVEMPAA